MHDILALSDPLRIPKPDGAPVGTAMEWNAFFRYGSFA
jgi:hypothetical protein